MQGCSGSGEKAGTRAATAGQHWRGKREQRSIPLIRKSTQGFPTPEGKEAGLRVGDWQVPPEAAGTSLASSSDLQAGFPDGQSLQPAPPHVVLTNESKFVGSLPSSDTNSLHILTYMPLFLLSQRGGHDPLSPPKDPENVKDWQHYCWA